MREEIFGPVLPIVRAENLEEAIELIRKSDKPLSAYIFTNDKRAERKFLEQVSCGNACVNDVMMFMAVHELPFGGVGPSGMGSYHGRNGFETFSHMKAVMRRGWWPDLATRYAPHMLHTPLKSSSFCEKFFKNKISTLYSRSIIWLVTADQLWQFSFWRSAKLTHGKTKSQHFTHRLSLPPQPSCGTL
jgi:hypothetical protein